MLTYVKRHRGKKGPSFSERPIEGGSGMRLASSLERGNFSEKGEGRG